MIFTLYFIFLFLKNIHSLTCDEVLQLPKTEKSPFKKLYTMIPSEIVKCIADLTSNKLISTESQFIWQSIKKHYKGVEQIPTEVLMVLHWATPAISTEEYLNITLDDIDVVQNFGLDYNLHKSQLAAIADRVRETFANKQPEDYTYYDLTALRNILCAFNKNEIQRIHPSEYKEAALMIGKLDHCSGEALSGFAQLAQHKDAFGPPEYWERDVVKILGNVLKYVPKKMLKRELHNNSSSSWVKMMAKKIYSYTQL